MGPSTLEETRSNPLVCAHTNTMSYPEQGAHLPGPAATAPVHGWKVKACEYPTVKPEKPTELCVGTKVGAARALQACLGQVWPHFFSGSLLLPQVKMFTLLGRGHSELQVCVGCMWGHVCPALGVWVAEQVPKGRWAFTPSTE